MDAAKRVASLWLRKKIGQSLWMDRSRSPKGVRYPKSKWDKLGVFGWATPAANLDGSFPEPWRVSHKDIAETWLRKTFRFPDLYTDHHGKVRGREAIWVGLRDNRNKETHEQRIMQMFDALRDMGFPVVRSRGGYTHILLVDDLDRDVLR